MKKQELKYYIKKEIRSVLYEGNIASKIDSFGSKISSKLGYFGSDDFIPKSFVKYITGKDKFGNKIKKKEKDKLNPPSSPIDKKTSLKNKNTLYKNLIGQKWEDNKEKIINKLKLPSSLNYQTWENLPIPLQKKIKDYLKQNPNEFN